MLQRKCRAEAELSDLTNRIIMILFIYLFVCLFLLWVYFLSTRLLRSWWPFKVMGTLCFVIQNWYADPLDY